MFWAAFARYSVSGISFLAQLILARLLAPQAFGIVAAISVVLSGMQIFQDLGLGKTLIARKDNTSQALNVTFILSVVMGSVLMGAMLMLAPLMSVLFHTEEMTSLLRLASLRLFISSFVTVQTALLEKELRFRALAWPRLAGTLMMSLIAILMASSGFGAWSIVWGSVVQTVVEAGLIWFTITWRPSLAFDVQVAADLLSYGKHIVGISLGTFLHANLDTVLVGQALGMIALGQYNLAFTLANALPLVTMQMAAPVLLPAFSQMQDDRQRLANAHIRFFKYILLIITPMCVILGILAQEVIMVFYGVQWREAVIPLMIFCLYALIRQLAASNSPILMVTNRVKEFNFIVYIHLALFVLLAFPAIWVGGVIGMCVLMVMLVALSGFLVLLTSSKVLHNPLINYARLAVLPACTAMLSSLLVYVSSKMLNLHVIEYGLQQIVINVLIMTAKAVIFFASYISILYLLDAEVNSGIRANLLSLTRLRSFKTIFRE